MPTSKLVGLACVDGYSTVGNVLGELGPRQCCWQLGFVEVVTSGTVPHCSKRKIQRCCGLAFGHDVDEFFLGHFRQCVVGAALLTDGGHGFSRQIFAACRASPMCRIHLRGVGQGKKAVM